jgi:dihydrodipicolinate synthase/N-acetylneuraminate lyase
MTHSNASGTKVLVALPTIFTADGGLDLEGSAAVAGLVATSRADGAFVAGTTGEFPALEAEERLALFETARTALAGKRLIGHIGAASTRQSLHLLEGAQSRGVTEFAALTPYYLPSSPAATYDHFVELSAAADGSRIYVYLFEARTTTKVTPAELARIAELPGIVGVKLSGIPLESVLEYRAATPPEFEVFTGNDADFPVVGSHGIDGVVSGVASVFPESFDRMITALDSGDEQLIRAAHAEVLDVVTVISGDIQRIKIGLDLRGVSATPVRMAIEGPNAAVRAELERAVAAFAR